MKNFLKNSLTILGEFIVLILAIIWYYNTKEIEPLIAIILATVALISSGISYFIRDDSHKNNIIGTAPEKVLHEDFLYNYVPGNIIISKIIEDLGHPKVKLKDYVELEWQDKKKFKFFVYKYKFANAVVLFTTEEKDENIISISLISKLDKKNPIKCRFSYAEDDKNFGEAVITDNIIENSIDFKHQNYASWMYSSITARYANYRPIKYLEFTYFIYNPSKNKNDMKNKKIDGICISTMSDIKPIIHFDDYSFG